MTNDLIERFMEFGRLVRLRKSMIRQSKSISEQKKTIERNILLAVQRGNESTNDDPSLIGTGAIKYDAGKPAVWRGVINYFPRALWGVAEISTFGANKYAWAGWESVEDGYARYQDARFRHSLKASMGEELDPDSELLHLKHDAWGALAALELYLREKEKNG